MRRTLSVFFSSFAFACSGGAGEGDDPIVPDGPVADCEGDGAYPPGATEPMTLGETMSPYRWPEATHRGTGLSVDLDLATAPCNTDTEIDWSPFDVLLFVSIPAW